MTYITKRQETAQPVGSPVHIHLPNKAFEPGAENFWFSTAFGAAIMLLLVAPLVNK